MNHLRRIAGLAASFAIANAMAQEFPGPEAYAYRFPVEIERPAEYLAVEVPIALYRSVSDPTLRDVGVYNAGGQAVPRMLRQEREVAQELERETALGMVPLYGELEVSQERLRLLMQTNEAGTTLQFDSQVPEPANPELQLRAVIVDLRDHEEAFSSLAFSWSATTPGFIGRVQVDDSDDLQGWRRLATGTLADLEFEGTRIDQDRVELDRAADDFLRITWYDMPGDWRLESVRGIRRERGPEQQREWLELAPLERSEDGREFVFHIGGYPPIDRINLLLPGGNVVVRASVESRNDAESSWRHTHQGLFYQVTRSDNAITSEPAKLAIHRAAQWRVRIQSGQVEGPVHLHVGWRPERLLFLAQGEAPFTVAAGRAQDRLEGFPQQRLFGDSAIFTMLEDAGAGGTATLAERQLAAGAMVMEGARTWTWRTVLVWIGLILAVLFVGWLAWSLLRETK